MLSFRSYTLGIAFLGCIANPSLLLSDYWPWDDPAEWEKMVKRVRYESSHLIKFRSSRPIEKSGGIRTSSWKNRLRCEHYKFFLLCALGISDKIKDEIEQVDCSDQQCIEKLSILFVQAVALSAKSKKNGCAQGSK